MEGRAALARRLIETRVDVADAVLERLGPRSSGQASGLIVRSLVSALGQSLDAAGPEPMVAWARMAHSAYALPIIHDLVATACDVAAGEGERLDLDFSALLVFLEIVKANVAEAFPLAASARHESPNRATNGVIEGVLAMLKARDEATCAHSQATGAWCRRLSEAMGLSATTTDVVVKAGVLHDIGKIATPDAILFKEGPLDDGEWAVMQKHAEFGAEILARAAGAGAVRADRSRAPRALGRQGLSARPQRRADPVRSARRRGGGCLPCDDQQPAVPPRDRAARGDGNSSRRPRHAVGR